MITALLIFVVFLIFPEITSAGMKNGLVMLTSQIIPALYPFILITTFLKQKSKHHKCPSCLPIILGFLSGYPLGAKIIADHWHNENIIPAQAMLIICNNPSPSYMISFVGLNCLKSPKFGFLIYLSVLIGNLITGTLITLITRKMHFKHEAYADHGHIHAVSVNSMDELFQDTFTILLNISNYILIFSILSAFIKRISFLTPVLHGIISGLLEMTSGIQILSTIDSPYDLKLLLITGIVSFGGLSVIAQTRNMTQESTLSIKKYITEKAIASTMAMSVMYLILHIL